MRLTDDPPPSVVPIFYLAPLESSTPTFNRPAILGSHSWQGCYTDRKGGI